MCVPTLRVRYFRYFSVMAVNQLRYVKYIAGTTTPWAQSDQWVEEFVDVTDADVSAIEEQQDFWSKLENQWKEMAETKEHPWLDDYDEVSTVTQI